MSNTYTDSEIRLPIRPNDFDYAAYLNNAVYIEYLEAGRVEWAALNRINLYQLGLAPAVVRLEVDYLKGLLRGKDVPEAIVRTTLSELKPVRMIFHQSVGNQQGEVCARAVVQVVMVDLTANKAVPVRWALERLHLPDS